MSVAHMTDAQGLTIQCEKRAKPHSQTDNLQMRNRERPKPREEFLSLPGTRKTRAQLRSRPTTRVRMNV